MLSLKDFDYSLPRVLIAQEPVKPRDHARLLCLAKNNGALRHRRFDALGEELRAGDVLVINDSKVFPARLIGRKSGSGGEVEVFLHRLVSGRRWECLVGGRVHPDLHLEIGAGLTADLVNDQGDGTWLVDFNLTGDKFHRALERIGRMPLPPYITPGSSQRLDRARYQTVYADDNHSGSVAAPTAGLHFTERLLNKLKKKGVKIVRVTLHVGLGTFAGVKTEKIEEHKMHSELAMISVSAARAIAQAKKEGRRLVAVGTTSCRVLESYGREIKMGRLSLGEPYQGWTDIFIYPGYEFQLVDGLITNFHLPKSSLLMLVSAFAGYENIRAAYQEAIAEKYRFYSYGDAMIIS